MKHSLPALLVLFSFRLHAQSAEIPLRSPAGYLMERMIALEQTPNTIFTEIKPLWRSDVQQLITAADSTLSTATSRDIQYLIADNNEYFPDAPAAQKKNNWRRYFFPVEANLLAVDAPGFTLRADPVFHFQSAYDAANNHWTFYNQRGAALRATVDKKLFIYTDLLETQAGFPEYIQQYINRHSAIPGAGFYKPYNSNVFKVKNGYDFNIANAFLGFRASPHFSIQLGHGKHFLGHGYRSLLLSGFSAPAFYLQLDTRIWKFHYRNLFLEISPVSQINIPDGVILPKKYAAMHYLGFRAGRKFNIGFFEATVFNRSRQFEFQYLNPVILYRTVEGMIGSPDNVLLGAMAQWRVYKGVEIYAQALLDELVASELLSNDGWWANKWGIQAGLKYYNAFGLDHFDIQLEHNSVRPYTFSHYDPANSYTHYNQPLAHPLGANFSENIAIFNWQASKRLAVQGRLLYIRQGENTATQNWGADPMLNYDTRVQDYGNTIGQGAGAHLLIAGVESSWALWHNLYVDFRWFYRQKNGGATIDAAATQLFGAGLRMNCWPERTDF